MKVDIEIDEPTVRRVLRTYLNEVLGLEAKDEDIRIMVKSKQNYRSEWEQADFKAEIHKVLT